MGKRITDDCSIMSLPLSCRARNALWRQKVMTVGELRTFVAANDGPQKFSLQNVGIVTTREIRAALACNPPKRPAPHSIRQAFGRRNKHKHLR